ncbi:LmeA family phospholipid-binding protein [Dactylosporangium matsuzakiense]|uniref:DUF2993 family protein n=1 Tax=Dactylosporangium matsuzakiense TaxID=53360 RepID=A0A9W6KU29_9ACTN|nr:DUF2993 domain-containing protein [Dactylosporangium matsuzakiense]UWZ42280.1 DUF2993 domain-containing protein [Dactylosporangium matsuzakiense]GLL07293.1 hypothetical protein GCM10017581_090450 [Dactylosporangium matsuzakiense]
MVVAALLLVVASVVADRVAAAVAADRIADRLQCLPGVGGRPQVTVRGLPLLPQVLAGRYRRIDITVNDLRRGQLHLATVRASLRDAGLSSGGVSVGAATVEAVVGFDVLPTRVGGRDVTYGAAGGLLAIVTVAAVGGQQLPVTVLARPTISDGTLLIEPQEVEIFGIRRPAKGLLDRLGAADVSRTLPDLPAGLQYHDVTAGPDGLTITVTGDDLSIHRPTPAPGATPVSVHCGEQS